MRIEPVETSLFCFTRQSTRVMGQVELQMVLGEDASRQARTITFMIVGAPSQYYIIMGRPAICGFGAIVSIGHMRMKYLVEDRDGKIVGVGIRSWVSG